MVANSNNLLGELNLGIGGFFCWEKRRGFCVFVDFGPFSYLYFINVCAFQIEKSLRRGFVSFGGLFFF